MPSSGSIVAPSIAAALLLAVSTAAHTQTSVEPATHWAFSSYFGTGRYAIDDGESVTVLSIAPRWQIREAGLENGSSRDIGIASRLNLAIGAYELDAADIGSTLRTENVSTLSVVPGIELEIPLTSRWSIKPHAYAGWGTEGGGGDSAWIYWLGLRSRIALPQRSVEWAIVNSLTLVGYASQASSRDEIVPLFTGIELEHPVFAWTIGGEPARLYWRAGYTKYFNELELTTAQPDGLDAVEIDDEWEFGAAFGRGQEPLRLGKLRWDRIGLVYRFNREDGYAGVGLTFRSFFDQ